MELNEVHLDKNRSDRFEYIEIRPTSDWHFGDSNSDTERIKQEIKWAQAKDNRFLLLLGDIMDCATIHSVSNSYESNLTPHQELKGVRKIAIPAKDKIIASVMGNHERRIYKNDGMDISEELARDLSCLYSRESLVLKLKFGKRYNNEKPQVYTIYMTHGWTGSRMVGGKANRLEKLRKIVITDVYIVGHSHQKIHFPKMIKLPDLRNNKITDKKQDFINTGAYLDYGGYGERKSYDPTDKGTVTIRMYGDRKRTEVLS